MLIPKDTHVILATFSNWRYVPGNLNERFHDLYAGRLERDFRYERGETILIDGPLGGAFPTHEVPLTPLMYEERAVGVSYVLAPGDRNPVTHLMMMEYGRPEPIDPGLAWPRHLHVTRNKIITLANAYRIDAYRQFCTFTRRP